MSRAIRDTQFALSVRPPGQSATMRPPFRVGNAGLELSRYLPEAVGGDNEMVQLLLDRVCGAKTTALYALAYQRWETHLTAQVATDPNEPTIIMKPLTAKNRIIVGLGAASVRESAITLHRAYGTPLIPGSALKGLARHYALAMLPDPVTVGLEQKAQGEVLDVLFGSQLGQAFPIYFDAWYTPGSATGSPLRRDVITVHHPNYYGPPANKIAPWDLDDPIPIPFISAVGTYLIAVAGPNGAWADFALELVCAALADWGVGAKTSSGYGRLT